VVQNNFSESVIGYHNSWCTGFSWHGLDKYLRIVITIDRLETANEISGYLVELFVPLNVNSHVLIHDIEGTKKSREQSDKLPTGISHITA